MKVGYAVGCNPLLQLPVEPEKPDRTFVSVGVYSYELKVLGLVYKKLPKPLAAYKSKAVFGIFVAEGV